MTIPEEMTGKQEYEHYAKVENQTPKGPARRRKQNLTEVARALRGRRTQRGAPLS
jgi:hypothetical protein